MELYRIPNVVPYKGGLKINFPSRAKGWKSTTQPLINCPTFRAIGQVDFTCGPKVRDREGGNEVKSFQLFEMSNEKLPI